MVKKNYFRNFERKIEENLQNYVIFCQKVGQKFLKMVHRLDRWVADYNRPINRPPISPINRPINRNRSYTILYAHKMHQMAGKKYF